MLGGGPVFRGQIATGDGRFVYGDPDPLSPAHRRPRPPQGRLRTAPPAVARGARECHPGSHFSPSTPTARVARSAILTTYAVPNGPLGAPRCRRRRRDPTRPRASRPTPAVAPPEWKREWTDTPQDDRTKRRKGEGARGRAMGEGRRGKETRQRKTRQQKTRQRKIRLYPQTENSHMKNSPIGKLATEISPNCFNINLINVK